MAKIKLTGSNSGYVEISSAADAGNLTLQLPTAGTALLSNAGNVFSGITTTGQLDINGSIDVSSTSVFNDDVTFTGASYNVLWDKSDNQLEFGNNAKLSFGSSSDLQVSFDSANSLIAMNTGSLSIINYANNEDVKILSDNGAGGVANYIIADGGTGEVLLHHYGNEKFKTTNTGVNITGICTATSFSGSGEGLTRTTQYSHRNVIVNGSCLVAQRGTSSASSDYGSVDRMKMTTANLDQLAFLQKQTGDGPDGFSKCFEFDVTTPENSLDADDLVYMRYLVERQDLVPFFNANGTGKNFTLSFYVKAYQAGTYQVGIYKSTGPRFIVRTYTIASSGVWQRVVLNFPGDTNTSGMTADTSTGFQISWIFAAGTNYTSSSPPTTWGGWPGNPGFAAGQSVNVASSANNYWRITGIQLELGDIATPFEHKRFSDELRDCQRYFQQVKGHSDMVCAGPGRSNGTTHAPFTIPLSVPLRASPTVNACAWAVFTSNNQTNSASQTPAVTKWDAHNNVLTCQLAGLSGMTNGRANNVFINSSNTFTMDAEL